jgi:hypothetical protein
MIHQGRKRSPNPGHIICRGIIRKVGIDDLSVSAISRATSPGEMAGICLINICFQVVKPDRAKITYLGDGMMV